MPPLGLLLIGSPSGKRDALELCARRHGAVVFVHSECTIVPDPVPAHRISWVLVTCDGKVCNLERHLDFIESRFPAAMTLFCGHVPFKQAAGLLSRQRVLLMPPRRSVETLEPLLYAAAQEPEAGPPDENSDKTILLHRRNYALDFREARQEFEHEHIVCILNRCSGNISRAARLMNMARRNLQLKIQAFGIDIEQLRGDNEC